MTTDLTLDATAARQALAQIRDAEDRDHALKAIRAFKADYGAKWPKAVAKTGGDQSAPRTSWRSSTPERSLTRG